MRVVADTIVDKGNGVFEITNSRGEKQEMPFKYAINNVIGTAVVADDHAAAAAFLSEMMMNYHLSGQTLDDVSMQGLVAILDAIAYRVNMAYCETRIAREVLKKAGAEN